MQKNTTGPTAIVHQGKKRCMDRKRKYLISKFLMTGIQQFFSFISLNVRKGVKNRLCEICVEFKENLSGDPVRVKQK
jgi:hypothetical protein